jgi:hypothetical protein
MTLQKTIAPLVLLMFTLVCALPATVVSPPSAIAQEDDDMSVDEAENLASDTVSNVLDNGNTAGDNTNTQLSVPLTDQDQTDANLGLSEALDVTVERTLSPQEEEEAPEFVAFCFESGLISGPLCFNTSEECEDAEEFLGGVVPNVSDCEGVEVLPPNALSCVNLEDAQGEIVTVSCESPEDT